MAQHLDVKTAVQIMLSDVSVWSATLKVQSSSSCYRRNAHPRKSVKGETNETHYYSRVHESLETLKSDRQRISSDFANRFTQKQTTPTAATTVAAT